MTVLIVALILSLAGNGMVFAMVLKDKQLQTPTNFYVVSLATADFLFASIALPLRIHEVYHGYMWTLGFSACRLWISIDILCCSASVVHLAAISVDRYIKISKPFQYNTKMTSVRVKLIISAIWIYASTIVALGQFPWTKDEPGIVLIYNDCLNINKSFNTFLAAAGFFLPLLILLAMYSFVFHAALEQERKVKKLYPSFGKRHPKRSKLISTPLFLLDLKATKTLVVVVSSFVICWFPFFVIFLVAQYNPMLIYRMPASYRPTVMLICVYLLPNFNSCCNPLIYACLNKQFRKRMKTMLFPRRSRNRTSKSFFSDTLMGTNGLGRRFTLSTRFQAEGGTSVIKLRALANGGNCSRDII